MDRTRPPLPHLGPGRHPSILHATSSPLAGLAALLLGIAAAWLGANLFQVAVGCCAVVLVLELLLV